MKQQNTLDYSALTHKIPFNERLKHPYGLYVKGLGLLALFVFIFTVSGILMGYNDLQGILALIGFGGLMALIALSVYADIQKQIRLNKFGSQNNLTYRESFQFDGRSGLIFQEGSARTFKSVLTSQSQPFAEIGNYEFTTGSGKSKQTHDYGFIKIKLPRKLPNIVLDSKKNNLFGRVSNLPTGLSKDQKLALEGDFNSYFTLYAPSQYKADALYVFTPDVMQALVDAAHDYDCEIVDDVLYLYSESHFDLTNVAVFKEIMGITSLLKKEFTEQTDYYADDRVGDRGLNVVAQPGVRLKRRLSTLQIIAIMIGTIVFAASFVPFVPVIISLLTRN